MVEKSKVLEKLYYEYTHLPLGGKLVRCPYWSNRQRILLSGPFKGKGMPNQITGATLRAADKLKIDLQKLSSGGIRKFMEHHRIGIDCSGFVYHMANALDKERGGGGIIEKVEGVLGNGPRRVNAFCLTNEKNSQTVKRIKDVRVGDFIRFRDGKHIAIVLRVKRDKKEVPREIVYAHSGRVSGITGVHTGKIFITDPVADIGEQKWLEKNRKGYEYKKTAYLHLKGDGIKRLNVWS